MVDRRNRKGEVNRMCKDDFQMYGDRGSVHFVCPAEVRRLEKTLPCACHCGCREPSVMDEGLCDDCGMCIFGGFKVCVC